MCRRSRHVSGNRNEEGCMGHKIQRREARWNSGRVSDFLLNVFYVFYILLKVRHCIMS